MKNWKRKNNIRDTYRNKSQRNREDTCLKRIKKSTNSRNQLRELIIKGQSMFKTSTNKKDKSNNSYISPTKIKSKETNLRNKMHKYLNTKKNKTWIEYNIRYS